MKALDAVKAVEDSLSVVATPVAARPGATPASIATPQLAANKGLPLSAPVVAGVSGYKAGRRRWAGKPAELAPSNVFCFFLNLSD
jgi:hypothetical protein